MTRKQQPQPPRVWEVPRPNGGMQTLLYENGKKFTTITPNEVPHEAVYLREYVESQYRPDGSYVHPPERGTDNLDITSYHPDQRTWAGAKANRPDVLFQYDKRGRPNPDHPIHLLLDVHGRVIIDADKHPVRHFKVLPTTISSQVEGWRMEAWMRLDSRITYMDLRARMVVKQLVSKDGQIKDMRPKNNALNMRRKRARGELRCQAWIHHKKPTHFDILLALEMTGQMRAENTTKYLTDLTHDEGALLKHTEDGSGFSKAGKQGLNQWVRDSRWQNVGPLAAGYGQIPDDQEIDASRFTLRWEIVRGLDFRVVEPNSGRQTNETANGLDGGGGVETSLVSRSLLTQRSRQVQAPIANDARNSLHPPQSSDALYTQAAPIFNPLGHHRNMNVPGQNGHQVEVQHPGGAHSDRYEDRDFPGQYDSQVDSRQPAVAYSDRYEDGDFASQYGSQVASQQPGTAYSDQYGHGDFTGPGPWVGANPPIPDPSNYPAPQRNYFSHAFQGDSGYGNRTSPAGDRAERISRKRQHKPSEENEQVGQQYPRGGATISNSGRMMSNAFPENQRHAVMNVEPFDRQKRRGVQPEGDRLTSASQRQSSLILHRGNEHETMQSSAWNHPTGQPRRRMNTRPYQMPWSHGQSDLSETVQVRQVDEFSRNSDGLLAEIDGGLGVGPTGEEHYLENGPANVDTRSTSMNHGPTSGSGAGNTNDTVSASPNNRLNYDTSSSSLNPQHSPQDLNPTTLHQTLPPPIACLIPHTTIGLGEESHDEGFNWDDEVISAETLAMLTDFAQSQIEPAED